MNEVSARAELAPSPPSEGALAATIDRSEIERALYAEDGEPALVLDVMQTRPGAAEGDTKRVAITWEREDLRRVLADTSSPRLTFAIDARALYDALEDDVEGHGFREKAAVLTVALATAAAGAASAQASVTVETGGGSPTAGLSGSYTAMENARSELTSTAQTGAALGAGYTAAEESRAELLAQPSADDSSLGAAYTAAEQSRAELLSQPTADEPTLGAGYTAAEQSRSELLSQASTDASSLGASYTAAEESRSELLSNPPLDPNTIGDRYTAAETARADLIGTADDFAAPASSGTSDVISAEDAGAIGAGAGMVALAIAAAAFASRHRRREGMA